MRRLPGDTTERRCSKCHIVKPLTEFHRDANRALGRINRCKSCVLADAEQRRRRRGQPKRVTPEYGGEVYQCSKCGVTKPVTDFHRCRGKARSHHTICKACAIATSEQWRLAHGQKARKDKPRDVRRCSTCHVVKPLSEFGRDKNNWLGHTHECKACRKLYETSERGRALRKVAHRRYTQSANGREVMKRAGERWRRRRGVRPAKPPRHLRVPVAEKRCSICQQIKPIEAFHRDKSAYDGRSHRCEICTKAEKRHPRAKYLNRLRDRSEAGRERRRRKKMSPGARSRAAERRRERRKEPFRMIQHAAQQLVNHAVKVGLLTKPDHCLTCGTKTFRRLEAHHYLGYAGRRALLVVWLCPPCHALQHRMLPNMLLFSRVLTARLAA